MFALRADRLFDGNDMVENPIVTIDGSKVVSVGRAAPTDVGVDDLGDVTLMPGLIDCHQHLCFDGSGPLDEQVATVSDDELADRVRANARRALRAGITTIRDLGDRDFVTLAVRGEPGVPTILASGPPLTARGGHCWFLGGECDDGDALADAIHERKRRGCDVVKVMVTGGALTPTFPMWASQFTAEEMTRAVATAHSVGLPVAAHCHGIEGTAMAIAAGVDTIEHCTFFTPAGRSEPDEALMDTIVAAGITVSATLGRLPNHVGPPVIEANLATVVDAVGAIRSRGGRIVVGTDAGISLGKPHDVLPFAADELAHIGVTGVELLTTLTSTAAHACGVGDRKGQLTPGFDADIIAIAGDPAQQAEALQAIRAVWHRGVRVA